jgi:putative two-component system response regulator
MPLLAEVKSVSDFPGFDMAGRSVVAAGSAAAKAWSGSGPVAVPASLLRAVPSPFSWASLQVQEKEEELRTVRKATICALNHMLDLKDLNTGVHSTRLAEWAVRIGQEMGIDDNCLEDIEAAALLHDAGKVGVPDAILRKNGPLEEKEWALMKMHPEYSWAVLRLVPGLERASLFALHHHEKYDGSGYPAGLRGEEIPIGARIVSVIDSFDAMVAERPYKHGLPCQEALRRLIMDSGRHFDPVVVQHFIKIASAEMGEVFEATGVDVSVAL